MLDLIQKGYLELQVDYIGSSIYMQFKQTNKLIIEKRVYTLFQALNNEQSQEMVIKEASTGETLSPRKMSKFRLNSKGEKTQYNLRNFWLFNRKSEELLISLLCPKVFHLQHCSHSNTNTDRLFLKLEMVHFYFFIFSLFLKVGENAVGLCVPRLLVPTGRRPSQRLQTSPYTRSELL